MIFSTLSVKALQAVSAVLLILLLIACTGWGVQSWRLDRAENTRINLRLERDDWRRAATDFEFANNTWADLAKQRAETLAADRAAAATAAKAAAERVRAAKLAERQAERQLAEFQRRPRSTTCSAALAALESACPELRGF